MAYRKDRSSTRLLAGQEVTAPSREVTRSPTSSRLSSAINRVFYSKRWRITRCWGAGPAICARLTRRSNRTMIRHLRCGKLPQSAGSAPGGRRRAGAPATGRNARRAEIGANLKSQGLGSEESDPRLELPPTHPDQRIPPNLPVAHCQQCGSMPQAPRPGTREGFRPT